MSGVTALRLLLSRLNQSVDMTYTSTPRGENTSGSETEETEN
ncbi:hypothetical protein [Haladaptatus sp. DFWS20]